MSTRIIADTRGMDREHWLTVRRQGIGGSDAAALVGLNEYATPFSVWADKRGILPEQQETEAIRLGRDLEPYVASRFAERSGLKVQRVNAVLGNEQYPFALANIDRRVMGRKRAGLECKTTSAWHVKEFKGGAFPDRYYVQCVHYLAVTGYPRWYVAALVMGQGFYVYQMSRIEGDPTPDYCDGSVYVDDGEIDALMGAEEAFWREHVLTGIPPAVDGEKPTTAAVEAMTGSQERREIVMLGCEDAVRNYVELGTQIEVLKKEQMKQRQAILLALDGAPRGVCSGWEITNTPSVRRTFDSKAFIASQPGDYSQYYKVSESMRFAVKETKK